MTAQTRIGEVDTVAHECYHPHRTHATPIKIDSSARLGCGCTRCQGQRCDGTAIEWLNPIKCQVHQTTEGDWGELP